ncbi:MAG: hypothetical protein E6J85_18990 [Deltaproteobacteria bacterium]|nr:MAG: hypothetical protein E6J85_18990 [Deltaproteobacteria bacterium]
MLTLLAVMLAASTAPDTGWPTGHLQLALKGGAALPETDMPLTMDLGGELGAMFDAPFGRIGPVVAVSYSAPAVEQPGFTLATSRAAAIVTAMALFDRLSRSGAPYLGIGVGPVLTHSHLTLTGVDRDRAEVRLGLGIVGGIAARFGPGSILFELRLLHAPSKIPDIDGITPAPLTISLGYRIWLFD